MEMITLQISEEEIRIIIAGLGKLPAEISYNTIANIQNQISDYKEKQFKMDSVPQLEVKQQEND